MTLKAIQVVYVVNFNTQIFPILHHEMTEGLQKIGFELSPGWPQRVPLNSRISGHGELARKGKTIIIINSDSQQLHVSDESVDSVLSNIDDLHDMFIEEYGIDIFEISKYFSFTGDYIYYTDKPAFPTISKKIDTPIVEKISKIMGHEMKGFQLNLAFKDLKVNSEEWYDFIIRPSYERDDSYIIRVVIRNPDREVINKLISEFEDKITDVIDYIEA